MSTNASLYFAKAIKECVAQDPAISKSLSDLGLQHAQITVAHQKGTDAHQVNLSFNLRDGDNIEGVARKFGMGVLPSMFDFLQKAGVNEKPVTEFFCVPQSSPTSKDAVVATFLFS